MADQLKLLAWTTLWIVVTALVVVGLASIPRDNSDPPGGRSGMDVRVDALTGCEYLSRRGLTPRVDGQGRHLGCRR